MEWLGALIGFLAVYLYIVAGDTTLSDNFMLHFKLLPIYLVGLFGVSIRIFGRVRVQYGNVHTEHTNNIERSKHRIQIYIDGNVFASFE